MIRNAHSNSLPTSSSKSSTTSKRITTKTVTKSSSNKQCKGESIKNNKCVVTKGKTK
jgi:hypothetical protein